MAPLRKTFSSFRMITLCFSALLFIGAFLLMLPVSSSSGHWTPFLPALFTSTSAACVTGLVVVDTASSWSFFGQAVILALIQVGGLGVAILGGMAALVLHRKLSLAQRTALQTEISAPGLTGITDLGRFVLLFTAVVEGSGAVLLSFRFVPQYGLGKGIWMGVFHSVSAFCNAGFDLMGTKGPFSSLTSYAGDPLVTLVIAFLIIAGGLGFLTWHDMIRRKWEFKDFTLQTKLILSVTLLLLVLPTLYFYFTEYKGEVPGIRFLASFFQAVTPRTAGFNTMPLDSLSGTSVLVFILLMLIGGAPSSTAGGMKVTTIALVLLSFSAVLTHKDKPGCFKRSLSKENVNASFIIFLMYILLFMAGGVAICQIDGVSLGKCLFEAASALGTVGLTLGITPSLSAASHIILIILMYIGRVGGITLLYAIYSKSKQHKNYYITENVIVG